MTRRRRGLGWGLAVALLFLVAAGAAGAVGLTGCQATPPPAVTPSPLPATSTAAATATAEPETPSPTPTSPPPTPTPAAGHVTTVTFPARTTGVWLGCDIPPAVIPPQGVETYRLRLQEGQWLTLGCWPGMLTADVLFTVIAPDRAVLGEVNSPPSNFWEGTLPQTGDYDIRVHNRGAEPVTPTLDIRVPAWLPLRDGQAAVAGRLTPCSHSEYLIPLDRSGWLSVTVASPDTDDLALTILGMTDRSPYLRDVVMQSQWSAEVAAQDYLVSVLTRWDLEGRWPSEAADFRLTVAFR